MTGRQQKFCAEYVVSRNPKEASLTAGYSVSFSKSKSYQLLKNPEIIEKITDLSEKYYKTKFQELALDAVSTLKDVMQNELSPSSQLQAVKYILSEAGVAEQDEKQTGIIEIKVKLPNDLQH